jgi:hypothetical protein
MHLILRALEADNQGVIATLQTKLREAEERRDELGALREIHELTYEVTLVSLWKDTGPGQSPPEQDVTRLMSGLLQDIIRVAEAEFKQINKRSDVQAKYSVMVVFKNGTKRP